MSDDDDEKKRGGEKVYNMRPCNKLKPVGIDDSKMIYTKEAKSKHSIKILVDAEKKREEEKELTAKVWSDIFDRYNVSDTENVWVKLTETNHVKSFDDVAFFPEDSYVSDDSEEIEILDSKDDKHTTATMYDPNRKDWDKYISVYSDKTKTSIKCKENDKFLFKVSGSMSANIKNGKFSNYKSTINIRLLDMDLKLSKNYLDMMNALTGFDLRDMDTYGYKPVVKRDRKEITTAFNHLNESKSLLKLNDTSIVNQSMYSELNVSLRATQIFNMFTPVKVRSNNSNNSVLNSSLNSVNKLESAHTSLNLSSGKNAFTKKFTPSKNQVKCTGIKRGRDESIIDETSTTKSISETKATLSKLMKKECVSSLDESLEKVAKMMTPLKKSGKRIDGKRKVIDLKDKSFRKVSSMMTPIKKNKFIDGQRTEPAIKDDVSSKEYGLVEKENEHPYMIDSPSKKPKLYSSHKTVLSHSQEYESFVKKENEAPNIVLTCSNDESIKARNSSNPDISSHLKPLIKSTGKHKKPNAKDSSQNTMFSHSIQNDLKMENSSIDSPSKKPKFNNQSLLSSTRIDETFPINQQSPHDRFYNEPPNYRHTSFNVDPNSSYYWPDHNHQMEDHRRHQMEDHRRHQHNNSRQSEYRSYQNYSHPSGCSPEQFSHVSPNILPPQYSNMSSAYRHMPDDPMRIMPYRHMPEDLMHTMPYRHMPEDPMRTMPYQHGKYSNMPPTYQHMPHHSMHTMPYPMGSGPTPNHQQSILLDNSSSGRCISKTAPPEDCNVVAPVFNNTIQGIPVVTDLLKELNSHNRKLKVEIGYNIQLASDEDQDTSL